MGGEFPVPILQGGANAGAVTIQFKEFGIRLLFTPQMTGNKTIKLALRQEVSTIDFANAVTLQGFLIPGACHPPRRNQRGTGGRPDVRGGRADG